MPSELPVIKVRTEQETVTKIKTIAKYNQRSTSKEIELLIKNHIEHFEKNVGQIECTTMTIEEIVNDIKDRINKKPPYGDNL